MTYSPTNRVPAGVPTGGQFATTARAEAEVALAPAAASMTVSDRVARADGAQGTIRADDSGMASASGRVQVEWDDPAAAGTASGMEWADPRDLRKIPDPATMPPRVAEQCLATKAALDDVGVNADVTVRDDTVVVTGRGTPQLGGHGANTDLAADVLRASQIPADRPDRTTLAVRKPFLTGEAPWSDEAISLKDLDLPSMDRYGTHEDEEEWTRPRPEIAAAASRLAARLEGFNLTANDPDLADLIEDTRFADRPYEWEDRLERLYDWADRERIWLEQ